MENYKLKRSLNPFKRINKGNAARVVVYSIVLLLFIVYGLTLVYPFIWIFINSFRSPRSFIATPYGMNLDNGFANYISAVMDYKVRKVGIIGMFGTSILLAGVGTVISIFMSLTAAYVMSKYKFKGREFLHTIIIISMTIPLVGTLPAQYKLMDNLGMINKIYGVWFLYSGALGFNFLFLYSSYKSVSWTYAEAAFIDGASHPKVFFTIMIPMVWPMVVAISVLGFIGLWNDYQTPSLYLKNMPTLAVGLNDLTTQVKNSLNTYTILFAMIILALLPIIAIFVGFQKIILNNTMSGGLKG